MRLGCGPRGQPRADFSGATPESSTGDSPRRAGRRCRPVRAHAVPFPAPAPTAARPRPLPEPLSPPRTPAGAQPPLTSSRPHRSPRCRAQCRGWPATRLEEPGPRPRPCGTAGRSGVLSGVTLTRGRDRMARGGRRGRRLRTPRGPWRARPAGWARAGAALGRRFPTSRVSSERAGAGDGDIADAGAGKLTVRMSPGGPRPPSPQDAGRSRGAEIKAGTPPDLSWPA